jgi:putative membrane protein
VTANDVDIEDGRLAKRRSQNGDVLAFAERMITEHEALNTQLRDVTGRAAIVLADNDTSRAMKREHETVKKTLEGLEGSAFDKAYLDREVQLHEKVIDQIDRVLLPNTKQAELRTVIESARTVLVAHRDQAKQLQQKLTSPPTPASIAP